MPALSAGIREKHNILLDPLHKNLLDVMAKESYDAFVALRKHPLFLSYLEKFSPLTLLSKITISSRPVKTEFRRGLKAGRPQSDQFCDRMEPAETKHSWFLWYRYRLKKPG